MQPTYCIFAGINGAGKTTLFKSNMWQTESIPPKLFRVNPDEIIKTNKMSPNNVNDQLQAGKIAINQINAYFEEEKSFTHETVFAGKTSLRRIKEAKRKKYKIILNYIGLKNYQLAIKRIEHRVLTGGHAINPELVKRRWKLSLKNFKNAKELCDEVHVFDNTELLKEIAIWHNGTLCWWGARHLYDNWLANSLLELP